MDNNIEVLNFDNEENFSVLETYGENLNRKNYVTDPAIGRDKEIKEALLILLTPEKSALLVGKAGIGKTAIVEGIGYRMQKGLVPEALKNYELIKVNISSLLGNVETKEGVNENKLQILVDELKTRENIIFISPNLCIPCDMEKDITPETRAMLEEQMDIRYFTPIITKIHSIKDEYGHAYFDVETEQGPCKFVIYMNSSSVVNLSDVRLLITDLDGNRFEIPDFTRLSAKELKMLDLFL